MNLRVIDLGLVDYACGLQKQFEVFKQVKQGRSYSALILCRHYPVITLGRRADENNIIASLAELRKEKVEVVRTERGGDVTYHGPGQLTAYPIFNLDLFKKDIHWFLRRLEKVIIDCLAELGVACRLRPGLTGVWVDKEKIASIGISVRNWITFHGLSLNVEKSDMRGFALIRPCGMDIKMTSVEEVLGENVGFELIKNKLKRRFELCAS